MSGDTGVFGRRSLWQLVWLVVLWPVLQARADILTLKNGLQYRGSLGEIAEIGEDPERPKLAGGNVRVTPIYFVDDKLRRTFISKKHKLTIVNEPGEKTERIEIDKITPRAGRRVAGVGPIIRVEPFDELGNRTFVFSTPEGPKAVIQGITEVTPVYTRVEGLRVSNSFIWEMRIATSSIPRNVLTPVLMNQLDPTNPNDRTRIVRLYIEAERFQDAEIELAAATKDFPDLASLKTLLAALLQRKASVYVREIQNRSDSGQHRYAMYLLENFPDEGVAGETLLAVKDLLDEYDRQKGQYERALSMLSEHLQQLPEELQRELQPAHEEIKLDLSVHTLPRMADYLRLADDKTMSDQQRVSLAISGWLLGSGEAIDNLAVTGSLFTVRNLVREYLQTTALEQGRRNELLEQLKTQEGAAPQYVAKLLAAMKPPTKTEKQDHGVPGLMKLSVPGTRENPQFDYLVQLPPEYDPYRRYPCVVTLNGAGNSPLQQLEYWTGGFDEKLGRRTGQATRHGYIVIAPIWQKPFQRKYEYSFREHASVMYALRDACRRFSVDTDRVFLSGHSMGGDAVWDIGLSHPDLWAGVIPIVARADKYVQLYWKNAAKVPFYFVSGELDATKLSYNRTEWNRYLYTQVLDKFDATIVEYQGRGHEPFHDEVQRLFEWMAVKRRNFFPEEFECSSLRKWDYFFWFAEVDQFPKSTMVPPVLWDFTKKKTLAPTKGSYRNNNVVVSSAGKKVTVWLSPEMVDFSKRIKVSINHSSRSTSDVKPDLSVMLDDARTRADRSHVYWAKVSN